jgi:dipeptidyl aminopeptidase/acylaminoacyl peptidase
MPHRFLRALALIFFALRFAPSLRGQSAETKRVLTAKDLAEVKQFAWTMPIRISHDGRHVAYTVSDPRRALPARAVRWYLSPDAVGAEPNYYTASGVPRNYDGLEISVSDIKSGRRLRPARKCSSSWGGVWSPDSKTLAYFADCDGTVGVWVWDRATHKTRRISRVVPRSPLPHQLAQWSPDGKTILLRALSSRAELAQLNALPFGGMVSRGWFDTGKVVSIFTTPMLPTGNGMEKQPARWPRYYGGRLTLLDVATGKARTIGVRKDIRDYAFSSSGRYVAYSSILETDSLGWNNYQMNLHVVDVETGRDRDITQGMASWRVDQLCWSPQRDELSFWAETGEHSPEAHVYLVNARSGKRGPLFKTRTAPGQSLWNTRSGEWVFYGRDSVWRMSVRDTVARSVATFPGREMAAVVRAQAETSCRLPADGSLTALLRDTDSRRHTIVRITPETGAVDTILSVDRMLGLLTMNGGKIVLSSQDATHPNDLWELTSNGTLRRITRLNPTMDSVQLPSSRLLRWTSGNGIPNSGILTLPPGYKHGTRIPTILWLGSSWDVGYGINRFANSWAGDRSPFLFAARGYAVLFPAFPMLQFERDSKPMQRIASISDDAISEVIRLGVADSTRLGIMSPGSGAYTAFSILVQRDRFKAAVVRDGVVNLTAFQGSMSKWASWHFTGYVGQFSGINGMPWQDPEAYVMNSPISFLDRVKAPVLLMGATDSTADAQTTEEIFHGLQGLRKPAVYVTYRNESGGLRNSNNIRDFLQRSHDWFDHYIKGAPRKSWMPPDSLPSWYR